MKIVTDNGKFHYNNLLAAAILKRIYPNATITRTRDESVIAQGDIVYDVGSIFDPSRCRFDHHQHTFTETYSPNYKYKLSSAGLIYKYYHKDFFATYNISHDDPLYGKLIEKVYMDYILPSDCVDNGVDIYGEVKPRTIYAMVEAYNDLLSTKQNDNFYLALEMVSKDLDMYIKSVIERWYYKYNDLERIIIRAKDCILIADKHYEDDLILEIENIHHKNIVYLIFPLFGKYKIRAISVDPNNFSPKVPLKKEWRGKRGRELQYLCRGAEYVHVNGAFASNKTLEGAIKMCKVSLGL